MPDLLELKLTIHTREAEAAPVTAATALIVPMVEGGAVVEVVGFGPYAETDAVRVVVRGYLPESADNLARLQTLRQQLLALPTADYYGELIVHTLAEADWAEAWKAHYHAQRVGEHFLICPTWEEPDPQPGDHIIRLDPGMAFGTGSHPSTRLILQLLEQYTHPGHDVLDVGTGSGILAIAAARLGARHVLATDIDPIAIDVARANLATNDVADRVELVTASVPDHGQYDILCANILADVIAELLVHDDMAARLRPTGVMLLAGIIAHRSYVVDLALAACGLHVVETRREDDWIALAVRPTAD